MEHAPRLRATHAPPPDEEPWRIVRRLKHMDGNTKCAWWYLFYELAGGQAALVTTNYADIGQSVRRGTKQGERYYKQLLRYKLIEERTVDGRGVRTVELVDPRHVTETLNVIEADPQLQLDWNDAAATATNTRSHVTSHLTVAQQEQDAHASLKQQQEQSARTRAIVDVSADTCDVRSDRDETPGPQLPTMNDQARIARELVDQLKAEVAHTLDDKVAYYVAWAIVEGDLRRADVWALITSTNKADKAGTINHDRASYFAGCCRTLFKTKRLDWIKSQRGC